MWIALVSFAVFAFIVIAVVLSGWNPFDKGIGQDELAEIARGLLITGENGAITKVSHRGSAVWFSFGRISDAGESAVLALRIPKKEWSEGIEKDLRPYFESHGFKYSEDDLHQGLIAQVIINVDNFWDDASGARGAHAARLLLKKLGVAPSGRFTVTSLGPISMRALEPSKIHRVNQS